jgi:hypothetical protein
MQSNQNQNKKHMKLWVAVRRRLKRSRKGSRREGSPVTCNVSAGPALLRRKEAAFQHNITAEGKDPR